jgi:hypothetical protein
MLSVVILNVIVLNVPNNPFTPGVIMLSVIMLNVVVLGVLAPCRHDSYNETAGFYF